MTPELSDIQRLSRIAAVTAAAHDVKDVFLAVQDLAADRIGHELFTVMAFNQQAMRVQRLYSSDEVAYPTGGAKEKRDTAWGRLVLEQGRHFIGNSQDDIAEYFNDATVMFDLGLHSILNVPIRVDGQTLGTMNLCNKRPGFYDESHLVWAMSLTALLASIVLQHQNQSDGA